MHSHLSSRRFLVLGMALLLALGGSVASAHRSVADVRPPEERLVPKPEKSQMSLTRSLPSATSIAIPVVGITKSDLRDTFGASRGSSRLHGAIDILSERGTPVVAAVDGSILKLYESGAGGLTIYLVDEAGDTIYYYAHLDRYESGIAEGDPVVRGEVIGQVGTTGNAPANTPHLHFSIEHLPPTGEWWKGEPVNPYPILMANGFTIE